jgi:hypothetical protein
MPRKALETDISPEKLEQFKQAEAELAAQMKLAGYEHAEDMEALAAADRSDARQRRSRLATNGPARAGERDGDRVVLDRRVPAASGVSRRP